MKSRPGWGEDRTIAYRWARAVLCAQQNGSLHFRLGSIASLARFSYVRFYSVSDS